MAISIEVTAATVRLGDVIQIGGQPCRVADLLHLPGGAKRLRFESGELLTLHARSRLIALRMQRVGDQRRGFSPSRHRR
ncbi:hypothetical protein ACFFSH_35265 [Streptomyces filamentosus]|uniref:Uncharacterized protein n=1 Tax=Streptomyces filamentosus TaxID=67294 RepID=A0A919BKC6_STRFL|nr:hypothetical protein [Streptomyces filamentosus]GHF93141.1 hypothetical protein GCM10017667_23580 [Streptomyces filamentosus]